MNVTPGKSGSGRWFQLKDQIQQTFTKLSDEDIEQLSGGMDELAGVVQQRYGYTRSQADREVNNWLSDIDKKRHIKA